MSGTPDVKRGRRHVASRKEWGEILIALLERDGEGCLLCGRQPVSIHHVIPRSLGGDDAVENLVGLCGTGTTGCHGLIEARDEDAYQQLGFFLHENVVAYVKATKGEGFLQRYLGVMS